MGSGFGRGVLHLAAGVDLRGAWEGGAFVELGRLAERGALDFVTLGTTVGRPGPDPSAVMARMAPETRRIGLVPALTTTHAEPLRVAAAVATLDWVSRGRAGWWIDVSATDAEARPPGRGPARLGEALWQEAGEVADAAARWWSSAEDGAGRWWNGAEDSRAETGNVTQGDRAEGGAKGGAVGGVEQRYARPAGVVGGEGPGTGPSAVPPSPQGRPVRVVDATGSEARGTAARCADVVLVRAAAPEQAAAVREEVRSAAAGFGRDPDEMRILAALRVDLGGGEHAAEPGHGGGGPRWSAQGPLYRGGPVDLAELATAWHRAGVVDGFHFTPVEPRRDLERLVNGTVALLQHRGLFRTFYPGSTLREHLGLARPADGHGRRAVAALPDGVS
ncbi:LLM class flavin-dependent oxidoreductase [Streptomyces neyagawaensis]|uniref:LLM class flavin-dependent oxidoreductase n=1 Tax=Streptomyces neyagawaensis TaxID=42238 RepID=UPI00201CF8F6|nr:LLM class flavin-dependent oxidoreductase [Streptomyces neyagawaensis]MCL6738756.1 LLM class flavin-dependent oxidoreductase [Streptomyces neyagawaensis]MDE1687888.1 LLM class flavin-dependent oxidoreductase [Streptomyces neyagawaensis]